MGIILILSDHGTVKLYYNFVSVFVLLNLYVLAVTMYWLEFSRDKFKTFTRGKEVIKIVLLEMSARPGEL